MIEPEVEVLQTDLNECYISIYKIEHKRTGICYIIQSLDTTRYHVQDFIDSSNDDIRNVIKKDGVEQFTCHILHKKILNTETLSLVEQAMKDARTHSKAVYNRNDPLKQRYSDQLMIELFCKHFNICYEEFVKNPTNLQEFAKKIEKYEWLVNNVQKAKLEHETNFSSKDSIDEIVNDIIQSITDPVVRVFAEKYEKKKRTANAIDCQDMILYAVYLLEAYPEICTKWREHYDYIHVDEFQDISPIDFRMINSLSPNLFAVGDDDQAIYGFRGGNAQIMQDLVAREKAHKYAITINYRSTKKIVEHSIALIENNSPRIDKNLRVYDQCDLPIKILEILDNTEDLESDSYFIQMTEKMDMFDERHQNEKIGRVEKMLINELSISDYKETAILVRYRSEVDQIANILQRNGFEENLNNNSSHSKGGPYKFITEENRKIRVSTIHSVKGKEYDRVILIHNTLGEDFPFDDSKNIVEDRRVFYVAMTRAKQELVIIGGECQFVWELRKAFISELTRLSNNLTLGVNNRLYNAKKKIQYISGVLPFLPLKIKKRMYLAQEQLKDLIEALQLALKSQLARRLEAKLQAIRKHHETELQQLRNNITEVENTTFQIKTALPQQIKNGQGNLLLQFIPVLDNLESISMELVLQSTKENNSSELTTFCEDIHSVRKQFLESLKIHGIDIIESIDKPLNPNQHEEILPRMFQQGVPKGIIVKELRRGYTFNNNVKRKARVIVSDGEWDGYRILWRFEEPVCHVTINKMYTLEEIMIFPDIIKGIDLEGAVVRIQKLNLMFAFPKTDSLSMELEPQFLDIYSNDNSISEVFLRSVLVRDQSVDINQYDYLLRIITRSGHTLWGYLMTFDEESLCMWIDERIVVVYRHALYEIERYSDIESIDGKIRLNPEIEEASRNESDCLDQTVVTDRAKIESYSLILKEHIRKLEVSVEAKTSNSPLDINSVESKIDKKVIANILTEQIQNLEFDLEPLRSQLESHSDNAMSIDDIVKNNSDKN